MADPSSASLASVPSAVLGSMSLRQVRSFKPTEGQEPSAKLTDGGSYFGDLNEQRHPHGKGIALLGDGVSRYGGEWKDGHYHGTGSMIAPTFDYEGTWDMDEMHGFGTIHYKDTVVSILLRGVQLLSPFEATHKPLEYRGDFHKTYHRHGRGTMTYRNGDVYEGEWSSNRRNGVGSMRYISGERYHGHWLDDERNGEGVLHHSNGSVFRGTFERDKRHGDKCVLTFPGGDEYMGQFQADDITGMGLMRYKNGDVYEGMWKDGVRHGKGKFELKKKGATIEGTFVKGLIDGCAEVTFPGKSKYVGQFEKGEKVWGTMYNDVDGSCYQGEWRTDHMHGLGLWWCGNGDFYYGRFANSKREGFGNCNYVDGSEYSGEFLNDSRHGKGIAQSADGSIRAGYWQNDTFVKGYQGEWDGIHYNGLGSLQLGGDGTSYFGLFLDGMRDGYGVMKIGRDRCNAAALAAWNETCVWHAVVDSSGHKALVPPRHQQSEEPGMLLFGMWRRDQLHGQAYIRYPNGDTFEGFCADGLRESPDTWGDELRCHAGAPLARIATARGSAFVGSMRRDGQAGSMCVFVCKDPNKPIYDALTDEEKALDLAYQVERQRAESAVEQQRRARDSAGLFDMLNPMNLFRGRSNSGPPQLQQAVSRRVVGYETDFLVVGPWTSALRDESVLTHILGVSTSSVLPGSRSSKTLADRTPSPLSPVPVQPLPPLTEYATGAQCSLHTYFYQATNTVFQVELCEGRPVLFLPHCSPRKFDLPLPSRVSKGDLTSTALSFAAACGEPAMASSTSSAKPNGAKPACPNCKREFGMFRKAYVCDSCGEPSCNSCLNECNPISFDKEGKLFARIAARFYQKEGINVGGGGGSGGLRQLPFHLKTRVGLCPLCTQAVPQSLFWGTFWQRLPQTPATHGPSPAAAAATSRSERGISQEPYLCYRGPLHGNQPHGLGELWYGDRSYYRGMFSFGMRSGYGQQIFLNGEWYVGEWHHDQRNGVGRYCCRDGSTIIGLWKSNALQAVRYHGDVDNWGGVREGRGRSIDPDGTRFNGEWANDAKCGSGILQLASGDIYSGSFVDDRFHGVGKYVHQASVYIGAFHDGLKHGIGVERFGDRVMVGTWIHGSLTGNVRIFDGSKDDVSDCIFANGEERRDIFVPHAHTDDSAVLRCHNCHAEFGFFLRKHHCRLCGCVFCDDCSKKKAMLPKHFFTETPQRVCNGCFDALQCGQSLAIRRYASGAIYCGLWANGAWTGSGLYRRPEGDFYLLNSYATPGVSAVGTPRTPLPGVATEPDPSAAAEESGDRFLERPRTEECHRHLPADCSLPKASEDDVRRFHEWWGVVVQTCDMGVFPLTFEKASEVEPPRWNPTVDLRLFSLNDEEDETAATRRKTFQPLAIPEAPVVPTQLLPAPEVFDRITDFADEAKQVERITASRMERFMPFPPPTPVQEPVEGAPTAPADMPSTSFDVISSADVYRMLHTFQRRPINAATPARPEHHSNVHVPWTNWACYPVPEYRGSAGSLQEPFMKSIPLVSAQDWGKRDVVVGPLDGSYRFELRATRASGSEIIQVADEGDSGTR